MRRCLPGVLVIFLLSTACTRSSSSLNTAEVEKSVRSFAAAVALDVTHGGPAAWQRLFSDSPTFFMASEGRLVFPDRATARAAIQDLARNIKLIELTWGDDLRVDPLTDNLAVMGATYHEIRVSNTGDRVDETGFFTGTAEYRDGRWQFRNAHWSVIVPPSPVR